MKLNVYNYNVQNERYQYSTEYEIIKAPKDTDWSRWAMVYDGSDYRVYFFKAGSEDTLYQFAFNGTAYEFGYNSIPEVKLLNKHKSARSTLFAMLHDGSDYRLYLADEKDTNLLHQFEWNGEAYEYIVDGCIEVTGMPALAQKDTMALLHDGDEYRYYQVNESRTGICQAVYVEDDYQYINTIDVDDWAENGVKGGISMVHGDDTYWLYTLKEEESTNPLKGGMFGLKS